MEHISSKYGFLNETANAQRSSDEQKHLESLIAFVFAVASHQTADATWHAIRLPTGFLAALAGVDFGGDSEAAHTNLDVGGDFLMAARLGRLPEESRQWIANSWVVPVDDLIAIYQRIGRSVSKTVLRYCCMRGLAAMRSELTLGGSLYETFAAKSPMMMDEVDGYYLGGIDEMSARTVNCWANLTRWFSGGIDAEEKLRGGWGICDVFQAIKARGGTGPSGPPRLSALAGGSRPCREPGQTCRQHLFVDNDKLAEATRAEMANIKVETDSFGAEIYTVPPRSPALPERAVTVPRRPRRSAGFDDPIYVATYVPYGHLGSSISAGSFLDDPSQLAFAVGAPWESEDSSRPGEGNVYIVPNSFIASRGADYFRLNKTDPLRTRAASGGGGYSPVDQRFGTASVGLTTLGRRFLAVSAPGPLTYDPDHAPSLPFHEQVPAGSVKLFVPGQAEPALTLRMRGAELGSIGRRQWGGQLLSAAPFADSDDEVLVVSGSRTDGERACQGRVRPQYGEGEVTVIRFHRQPPAAAAAAEPSPKIVVQNGAGGEGVAVTAWYLALPARERESIPCSTQTTYAYYGSSTAFSAVSNILWVSAPGRGKVFGYRLSPEGAAHLAFAIADEDFALRPRRTGFGTSLATGVLRNGDEWIAVSAPNEDRGGGRGGGAPVVQVGTVRLYLVGSAAARRRKRDLLAGERSTPGPLLVKEIVPDQPAAFTKFGRTLETDSSSGLLWAGSEFADGERGRVWRIDVERVLAEPSWGQQQLLLLLYERVKRAMLRLGLAEDGRAATAETMWEGAVPGERFGASIVVTSSGDVLVGVPRAGVSRAKQEERFFGALMVFRRRKVDSTMWACSMIPSFGVFSFPFFFFFSVGLLFVFGPGSYVMKHVLLYIWA